MKTETLPRRRTWNDILKSFQPGETRRFPGNQPGALAVVRVAIARRAKKSAEQYTTAAFNNHFTITRIK